MKNDERYAKIRDAIGSILDTLGANRPGTQETPDRVARFLLETCGEPPPLNFKVFPETEVRVDGMQVQDGIQFSSLCEHHMLPFFGTVSVGYLPSESRLCGLSKLARVVHHYSRGMQVQERIAHRVAEYLFTREDFEPIGVGVSIRAYHSCMTCRGVRQPTAVTTSNVLLGAFQSEPVRLEFLKSIRHPVTF